MAADLAIGDVSRETSPLCSRCGRPRDRDDQRYCRPCHASYMRNWRAGKIEVLLTIDEWDLIKNLRIAFQAGVLAAAGRHARKDP